MSFPGNWKQANIFFRTSRSTAEAQMAQWDEHIDLTTSKISSNHDFLPFAEVQFCHLRHFFPPQKKHHNNCQNVRPVWMKVMTITTWSSSSIARCVCRSQDLPSNPIVFSSPWRQMGGSTDIMVGTHPECRLVKTTGVFKGRGRMRRNYTFKMGFIQI